MTRRGSGPRSVRREPEPLHAGAIRWPFAVLAYLFVGLALVGVVVPGLPTTPFVLLAAWAASRGSRRVHDWLHAHPRLGPALSDWEEQRAVSTRAKVLAATFLAISWGIMFWRGVAQWLLVVLATLFVTVAVFVVTRRRPDRSHHS